MILVRSIGIFILDVCYFKLLFIIDHIKYELRSISHQVALQTLFRRTHCQIEWKSASLLSISIARSLTAYFCYLENSRWSERMHWNVFSSPTFNYSREVCPCLGPWRHSLWPNFITINQASQRGSVPFGQLSRGEESSGMVGGQTWNHHKIKLQGKILSGHIFAIGGCGV